MEPDPDFPTRKEVEALEDRIRRLEKINRKLIARVERGLDAGGDAFAVFQTAMILEQRVTERTLELNQARQSLEASNRELQAALVAAADANEVKSQFLAVVSHELRTPLNGVLGMAELLAAEDLPAHAAECVATIRDSANVLLRLLNDILDLARIESRGLELEHTLFDPVDTMRRTVELFRANAQAKDLQLDLIVADGVPTAAVGEPVRLRQVLSNLVGNAIKFTDAGTVRVELSSEVRDGRTWLRVAVEDQGAGIPEAALEQLFQPFFQVDSSHTRQHGGTGLGLSISRQIARHLGGDIHVQSVFGAGSRFELHVPLDLPAVGAERATPRAIVPTRAAGKLAIDGRAPVVLVVDDNPVNLRVAQLFLKRLGCESQAVAHGATALEICTPGAFDAVLLDRQMPGLDGCEVARALRLRGHREPLIALTASAMAEDRDACLAAGMDDFLTKPLSLDDLRRCLARLLASSTAHHRD